MISQIMLFFTFSVLSFAFNMNIIGHVVMKRTSALFLIISACFWCSLGSSDFFLSNLSMTYEEAKNYCRETYTDLATVHNSADMESLIALVSATDRAWIGLEIGEVQMWHWSLSDEQTDFFNWRTGEPKKQGQEACAAMDRNGTWFESDCIARRSFVCVGSRNASRHIFVAEAKSWRDAQSHCRGASSDLVSVHSVEDNDAVRNVSASGSVWIGLFRDPWKWSDGSSSSFRFWKPNQPNYLEDQMCVAAIFKDEGKWNDLRCSRKFRFICQGARKSNSSATSSQTTKASITADKLATTSPQKSEITPTFHVTAAASEQPSTTNVNTPASTTAELTTPNTTEFVSHLLSTGFSSPNTERSTITQPLPTASASTATATVNSQTFNSENLVLIQENVTWTEAMTYCREHHIDLVHITTKDVQDSVAEKAKNATSSHVWLGLRYTCTFQFWFWIESTSSCYQNWVPGQGPDGVHECGVSGAIEATGRQQWVGLPEKEELNFICYTCAG